MNWNNDNLGTVAGYECPNDACSQTKQALRKLSKSATGLLVFTHDDGPSAVTRHELVDICGTIGLSCFEESHRIVILDEEDNKQPVFHGAR